MSRSVRTPIWTQGYGGKARKFQKCKASRSVRAAKEVANGKAYKKEFNSWDICDFKITETSKKRIWKVGRK